MNLALIYGGRSVEHDVSVLSAQNILSYTDPERFKVHPIGIDKQGKWFLMDSVSKEYDKGRTLSLVLDASSPKLLLSDGSKELQIDAAIVILHGTDGEDGTIQGFWKMFDIPVVGADVLGSSVAMSKEVAKKLMLHGGIPTAPCMFLSQNEDIPAFSEVVDALGTPVIVKPSNLGSSVGVEKVATEKEFSKAVRQGFDFDDVLLVEKFIEGRELECAVLGNTDPQVSAPGEITLADGYEIYSFDAKYVNDHAAELHIPADVEPEVISRIQEACREAFQTLKCSDLARVDLFLTESGDIYINEVNTLPGFTNISMYPRLCELMGYSNTDLITRLVELALERKKLRDSKKRDYISGLS